MRGALNEQRASRDHKNVRKQSACAFEGRCLLHMREPVGVCLMQGQANCGDNT